jgi:hypothetical protein
VAARHTASGGTPRILRARNREKERTMGENEIKQLIRDELCDSSVLDNMGFDMKEDVVINITDLIQRIVAAEVETINAHRQEELEKRRQLRRTLARRTVR